MAALVDTNILVYAHREEMEWHTAAAEAVLEDPATYNTVEAAAAVIYRKRDTAADRGSLVHSLAEAMARGAEINVALVPEEARGYAKAFLAWTRAMRPSPLFTEANV